MSTEQQRRSRYEKEGRDYKCQVCERTYLSYPAMYAHMKNKHAVDPQQATPNSNGKLRGRPKKYQANYNQPAIDPTTDLYLEAEDRVGKSNPLECFQEVYEFLNLDQQKPHTEHPLYQTMVRAGTTPDSA